MAVPLPSVLTVTLYIEIDAVSVCLHLVQIRLLCGAVAVGHPVAEGVRLDVEAAVACLCTPDSDCRDQIQIRLTGVVMGMSCIRADVVDCLGV